MFSPNGRAWRAGRSRAAVRGLRRTTTWIAGRIDAVIFMTGVGARYVIRLGEIGTVIKFPNRD